MNLEKIKTLKHRKVIMVLVFLLVSWIALFGIGDDGKANALTSVFYAEGKSEVLNAAGVEDEIKSVDSDAFEIIFGENLYEESVLERDKNKEIDLFSLTINAKKDIQLSRLSLLVDSMLGPDGHVNNPRVYVSGSKVLKTRYSGKGPTGKFNMDFYQPLFVGAGESVKLYVKADVMVDKDVLSDPFLGVKMLSDYSNEFSNELEDMFASGSNIIYLLDGTWKNGKGINLPSGIMRTVW